MCIKLVSIKELYYDARPTKSQDDILRFLPKKMEVVYYGCVVKQFRVAKTGVRNKILNMPFSFRRLETQVYSLFEINRLIVW